MNLGAMPMLPLAGGLICGILASRLGLQGWVLMVPLLVAGALILLRMPVLSLVTAAFTLGACDAWLQSPRTVDPSLWRQETVYSGVVKSARHGDASQQLVVEIDTCAGKPCRRFLCHVAIIKSEPVVARDDRIGVRALLVPPVGAPDFPDDYVPEQAMAQRGVVAKTVIREDDWLYSRPEPGRINDVRRWREKVRQMITRAPLSAGAMEFLSTTMTGDTDMLTPKAREVFSATGLSHVLALSGLHVGILAWLVSLALFPLYKHRHRVIRLGITLAVVWLFVLVTGMGPSVVRSALMVSIFVVTRILEREPLPINSLCFAMFVVLLFDPSALFGVAFQLTFLAVAAIVLISPMLNPFDAREHHWLHVTAGWLTVPVAAMLGTGVVAAYYFHIFPVYFLICNVATAFLLPFLLGAAVVLLICTASGFTVEWLGHVVDFIYSVIMGLAEWVSGLPGAHMDHLYLTPPVVWTAIASVVFLVVFLYGKRIIALAGSVCLAVISVCLYWLASPEYPRYESHITYEDGYTGMLVRACDTLWHFTTDARAVRTGDTTQIYGRTEQYRAKRGIATLKYMPVEMLRPGVSRAGNVVSVNSQRYVFVSTDSMAHAYPYRVNFGVICRGFTGDVVEAARTIKADTILLSRDLNARRHDRYARELADSAIAFKSLRYGYLARH